MMTIQDFDRELQEQGSKIQQVYGPLKDREVRGAIEGTPADEPWTPWS